MSRSRSLQLSSSEHVLHPSVKKFLGSLLTERPDLDYFDKITRAEGSRVSKGAYGDVHKAYWGDVPVAIKIIHIPDEKVDKILKDFRGEAKAWGKHAHINVLPFYGFTKSFDDGRWPAFVSPWMEDRTLDKYIERPDASHWFAWLLTHTVTGLAYLHSEKVSHGDLKPQNILITHYRNAATNRVLPRALLCDFGLAKIVGDIDYLSSATREGTARYAAIEKHHRSAFPLPPDQPDAKFQMATRSDVWSWGMTVFHVYSGKMPYHEIEDTYTVLKTIVAGVKPSVSSWRHTPHSTMDILMRASWENEPMKRKSAKEIVEKLLGAEKAHGAINHRLEPTVKWPPTGQWIRDEDIERPVLWIGRAKHDFDPLIHPTPRPHEMCSFLKGDIVVAALAPVFDDWLEGELWRPEGDASYCVPMNAAWTDYKHVTNMRIEDRLQKSKGASLAVRALRNSRSKDPVSFAIGDVLTITGAPDPPTSGYMKGHVCRRVQPADSLRKYYPMNLTHKLPHIFSENDKPREDTVFAWVRKGFNEQEYVRTKKSELCVKRGDLVAITAMNRIGKWRGVLVDEKEALRQGRDRTRGPIASHHLEEFVPSATNSSFENDGASVA